MNTDMPLKVIGAGFGRTGTLSLKHALEQLGFGPCYHMAETLKHPGHDAAWLSLARGETKDWQTILQGYQASVDWPGAFFWKMLAKANPDAKIILTVRDAEQWYTSAANTIFSRMQQFGKILARSGEARALEPLPAHMRMVNAIVAEGTFHGDLGRANAIAIFNAHNKEVRRLVPAERLLIYRSGEGWERLCEFLGTSVPRVPYPNVNSTTDFENQFPKNNSLR